MLTNFDWKELDGKVVEISVQEVEDTTVIIGVEKKSKKPYILNSRKEVKEIKEEVGRMGLKPPHMRS